MPSDEWYDNPAIVDVEDEEIGGNSGALNGTEDCFDFSDLTRSTDNDNNYILGSYVLRDTATSAPA